MMQDAAGCVSDLVNPCGAQVEIVMVRVAVAGNAAGDRQVHHETESSHPQHDLFGNRLGREQVMIAFPQQRYR
jgi:hypothetical protein